MRDTIENATIAKMRTAMSTMLVRIAGITLSGDTPNLRSIAIMIQVRSVNTSKTPNNVMRAAGTIIIGSRPSIIEVAVEKTVVKKMPDAAETAKPVK
ncbi:hypothetical protein apy_13130 [Aeropyrum pernix]|uniref:Uncharacterized protein n=1 Tax=Aeropyrum pernix TaxID=56636 RepID=A0A401HB41_AERPX|nr:hypothetical protein apy_13130 [Aeropyrum pernix]